MSDSHAELFFRSLFRNRAGAFKRLSALVTAREEENQCRDFKEAKFIYAPLPQDAESRKKEEKRRNDTVKRLWSENLSAFANTGGGVLIWGIEAPKRVAEKMSLAGDAHALEKRLKELQNDATDPPVQGVEVRAVTKGKSKVGFVICYIPESAFAPHRSIWAEREFYMRSADSNLSIPTALLRRMFYPHLTPWLVPIVSVRLVKAGQTGTASGFHVRDDLLHIEAGVRVRNCGNGSAEDAYIKAEGDLHCQVTENLPNSLWERGLFNRDGYSCKTTIHPNETVPFIDNLTNNTGFQAPDDDLVFQFEFRIYAHNAPAQVSKVSFTGSELKATLADSKPIEREGQTNLI